MHGTAEPLRRGMTTEDVDMDLLNLCRIMTTMYHFNIKWHIEGSTKEARIATRTSIIDPAEYEYSLVGTDEDPLLK